MKTEDLVLIAAIGVGVVILMKKKNSQVATAPVAFNPLNGAPVSDPTSLLREQMRVQLETGALKWLGNKISGLFDGNSDSPASVANTYDNYSNEGYGWSQGSSSGDLIYA